ncbi:MAG: hypothetical protein ACKV19_15915 [Verrucomicrobiales bacterium]
MAQGLVQSGAGSHGVGRAGLGLAGDGMASTANPPLPSLQAVVVELAGRRIGSSVEALSHLSERRSRWEHLTNDVRLAMDAVAARGAGRAGWQRVEVVGTGERAGGAQDWEWARSRWSSEVASAHLVIGNGTRSPDGGVERTSVSLDSESLVVAVVGDFARHDPTPDQLRALTEVVDYARAKTGVIRVTPGKVNEAPVSAAILDAAYNAGLAEPDGLGGSRE